MRVFQKMSHNKHRDVRNVFLVSLAIWTFWCVLMIWQPVPFANDIVRAFVRVGCVLLPALWFSQRHAEPFELWPIKWGEVGAGVIASVLLLGAILLVDRPNAFILPTGFATYFNFILGSPIVEELLFRGVIFRQLARRYPFWQALIGSSALFVVFHWPWWLLSGDVAGMAFLSSSVSIFVLGLIFAALLKRTGSLWPPVIFHILNNLVALGIT
ncbi:MAG: lysostaphin resistance A-like protein [Candidatus Promineifilaceae bacterium]